MGATNMQKMVRKQHNCVLVEVRTSIIIIIHALCMQTISNAIYLDCKHVSITLVGMG